MRSLLLLALLCPAAAGAETLADTHFDRNFCWSAGFDREHMEDNPEQRVVAITLRRERIGSPAAPGQTLVEVQVRLRGEPSEIAVLADCAPQEERLECRINGRAGDFLLQGQGEEAVLLSVGEKGMRFEGRQTQVLRADEGADQSFLLGRCG